MIGIIGATDFEMKLVLEKMQTEQRISFGGFVFQVGKLFDQEIVAVECGIGKVFMAMCTEAMCNKFDVDKILNIGAAGGLCDNMKKGDTVIVDKTVQYDMDTTPFGDPLGMISGINKIKFDCNNDRADLFLSELKKNGIGAYIGDNATADMFCTKSEVKKMLTEKFDCKSVDMECAALAQVCYVIGQKFESIKIISDSVNDNSNADYNEFTGTVGERVMQVLKIRFALGF